MPGSRFFTQWPAEQASARIALAQSTYDRLPELTTGTVIGITVAIAGNVLISLALNLQKLAHKRLDAQKVLNTEQEQPINNVKRNGELRRVAVPSSLDEREEDGAQAEQDALPSPETNQSSSAATESRPLLQTLPETHAQYGGTNKKSLLSRIVPNRKERQDRDASTVVAIPVDIVPSSQSNDVKTPEGGDSDNVEDGNEGVYLKSKLWYKFLLH